MSRDSLYYTEGGDELSAVEGMLVPKGIYSQADCEDSHTVRFTCLTYQTRDRHYIMYL